MSDMEHGYAEEARERWGHTDAYEESSRRTRAYSADDWKRIQGGQDHIEQALAEAMADGAPADGERAMDLAEQARLHIDRYFYPCSNRMHARLAEMYTADERFRAHYDERAPGLAEYVSGAIKANLARAGD